MDVRWHDSRVEDKINRQDFRTPPFGISRTLWSENSGSLKVKQIRDLTRNGSTVVPKWELTEDVEKAKTFKNIGSYVPLVFDVRV
jgi:hypothetical protein